MSKPWYRWQDQTLTLNIRVQPRASRDAMAGPHGERLRICITAPPVDSKANQHLFKFLAKAFGVARNRITLISGAGSRDKRVCIERPAKLPEGIEYPGL